MKHPHPQSRPGLDGRVTTRVGTHRPWAFTIFPVRIERDDSLPAIADRRESAAPESSAELESYGVDRGKSATSAGVRASLLRMPKAQTASLCVSVTCATPPMAGPGCQSRNGVLVTTLSAAGREIGPLAPGGRMLVTKESCSD